MASSCRPFHDSKESRTSLSEAIGLYEKLGFHENAALGRMDLADTECTSGNLTGAIALASEASEALAKIGHLRGQACADQSTAAYHLLDGNATDAAAKAAEALRLARQVQKTHRIIISIQHLATVAALRGDAPRAARPMGYSDAGYRKIGADRERTEQRTYDILTEALRRQLLDDTNQPQDSATALFLLDESKRHYEALTSGAKSVEGKATQVLALAAGGSSALVLFAVPKDGHAIVAGPVVDAALGLTLCALLALLFVLRVKARTEPSVAEYLSAPMAADPANRTALAMSLAEDFEARCAELSWARRRDPLAMFAAYLSLAAAALLIVLNAALQVPDAEHGKKMRSTLGIPATDLGSCAKPPWRAPCRT